MRKLLWLLLLATAMAQTVNTNILPASTGLDLGSSGQRWDGFFRNVSISGTCTGAGCGTGGGGTSITVQQNGSSLTTALSTLNFTTGMSCTAVGDVVTCTSTGGATTYYQTFAQAGSALTQRNTANFFGGITCVDNSGSTRTDCTLTTNAAVSNQFLTGVSSLGVFTRAQPTFANLASTPTTIAGYGITNAVANTLTVAGKALSGNITIALADLSNGTAAGIVSLFSTCSGVQYLGADGACHNAAGSGTVTVVASGSLTSTAIVTGGGTTTLQTPSATATLDTSGNFSTPGTYASGVGGSVAGGYQMGQGTTNTPAANTIVLQAPTSVTAWMMTFPSSVPTTGHLLDCTTSSTTCTLHDSGVVTANVLQSGGALGTPSSGTGTNITGIPAANVLSGALASGMTATTQAAKDNSTKVATTAYVDRPIGTTSGTSVSLTAPSQMFVCTSTCTVTPPVPAAGYQFCIYNGDNVSTVITMAALGSSAQYENAARTAYGTAGTGTLVSGGAAKDAVCLLGLDATHYLFVSGNGTWTAN